MNRKLNLDIKTVNKKINKMIKELYILEEWEGVS